MLSDFLIDNDWIISVSHLILAVLLFFLVNWIGKNSISVGYRQLSVVLQEDTAPAFNFLFKVLAPTVYLILCIAFFQLIHLDAFVDKCYLIVVYYWAIRLAWNLFSNRWRLLDWCQQIIYWIASIGISFWIYKNIEDIGSILPKGESLLEEMWLLIIVFLYSVINKMKIGETRTIARKDNYIRTRYDKFKSKYDNIIHPFFNNDLYEAITYSIMIYEDFNRPYMIRMIENLKFRISREPMTLGIMQMTTDTYITDKESVTRAIRKIASDINAYIAEQTENPEEGDAPTIYTYNLISYIADKYNGGDFNYSEEIEQIFDKINKMYYRDEISTSFTAASLSTAVE